MVGRKEVPEGMPSGTLPEFPVLEEFQLARGRGKGFADPAKDIDHPAVLLVRDL